ncbi:MAG: PKD domain-containing protein, partial [Pedobacter sp.]
GNIISYKWNFGDGDSSNLENPTHIYGSIGQYKVILKVTSSFGCSDTFSQTITIFPKPTAKFATQDICLSEVANFIDSSSGAADYSWSFGDGSIRHLQNPIHKYSTAGTYMVKLVVKNTLGCTDTFTKEIIVSEMPKAIFSVHNICFTENVELADSSSGATERFWKFGDDSNTDEQNPTHYYGAAGSYNIWLIVNNKATVFKSWLCCLIYSTVTDLAKFRG